ncbi:hypothetical protein FNV43_RR17604 [Rhamnella rubrinervis]|uniref:Uncharacterized protein n=1 Tax=Rhamnella rubrinervis TaxID=2594499 RepID=A0A8K0E9R2_9ROSA|nr:hypothetical protein FNV43_RR17604 [Rhamnella rubrinervis]
MEDLSGLYLLAEVCAQELEALSSASVPVKFPKKRRSSLVLIKNKTGNTTGCGLKLKVSPTHRGKRCYFQLGNGHVGDKIGYDGYDNRVSGVDYNGNKKQSVTATFASIASRSSSGDVDGHGNEVCGVDDNGKKKQRVSFTLRGTSLVNGDDNMEDKKQKVTASNFTPFASNNGSGCVDSHGNGVCGVDYSGEKRPKITATFSSFATNSSSDLDGHGNEVCGDDYTMKNKQTVTDSSDFALNSGGGGVDTQGNGAFGVDYNVKKKERVTATLSSFASTSSSNLDGHGNEVYGDHYKRKDKQTVTDSSNFASNSGGGEVDSHGNGVSGVDYNGKKKERVTATLSSFASTSSSNLDGHGNEVYGNHYTRKDKQTVTDSSNFALNSGGGGVDSHGNGVCGVDYNGKKKERVTATLSSFASTSISNLDGHGNEVYGDHYTRKDQQTVTDSSDFALNSSSGNGVCGVDYNGKKKERVTATLSSFASTSSSDLDGNGNEAYRDDYTMKNKQIVTDSSDFASSSCGGGLDGHGNLVCGVDYKGKKTHRVTFILSGRRKFDGGDKLGKKIRNQNITATASASASACSKQEEVPSTPSCTSGLYLPLTPQFRFHSEYPNLPTSFVNLIQAMGGSEVKLVIEKNLFKSDLDKGLNRLSIPCSQIKNEFLSQQEKEKMALRTMQNDGKHHQGLDVWVIEPCLNLSTLCLKKWDFNSSSSYVLIKNWNNVADKNKLKPKMTVQLWSFRLITTLCFALVNLSRP